MKFQNLPGETPLEDLSGLIPQHVTTRQELNELEFSNVTQAMQKYFLGALSDKKAPFTMEWLFKVHREMFEKVWRWAGQARLTSLNIGVAPAEISPQLKVLCEDLGYWQQNEMPSEEMAARLHHRLVQIHPFLNGNGRWARLITNIFLKKQGKTLIPWPEETLQVDSPFRKNYIDALQVADGGDFQALQTLHHQLIQSPLSSLS